MEYRCLIVGDPIVEPGALLRRLLYLDFPRREERELKRRTLRPMRERETKLLSAAEDIDEAQVVGASASEKHIASKEAMCISMPADDECVMRLPNPSIPSVDITIRFKVVMEPRELLLVLGLSHPGDLSSAYRGAAAPPLLYQPGVLPHAVVAVFNPFARRSFSKMCVEWRYFLSTINDAKEVRQASHGQNNNHGGALANSNSYSGAYGNRAGNASSGAASGANQHTGNGVSSQLFSDRHLQPLALAPSTSRMGFTLPDSEDTPASPLSPYSLNRGTSAVYDSLANPSMAPPVLLVGTRFELMHEAIEATPSISLPLPLEVSELASALGAKAYMEVGTYWDDTVDELRLAIARACVGEFSHSPVVRAAVPAAVRQMSVARALEYADAMYALAYEEHPTSVSSAAVHSHEVSEDDQDIDVDVSEEDAGPAVRDAAEHHDEAAQAHKENHNETQRPLHDTAQSHANASVDLSPCASPRRTRTSKSVKSQWTWRQHPETHRLFYVHRATRRSQYDRPADYDGEEPREAVSRESRTGAEARRTSAGPATSGSFRTEDKSGAELQETESGQFNDSTPPLPSMLAAPLEEEGHDDDAPPHVKRTVASHHGLVTQADEKTASCAASPTASGSTLRPDSAPLSDAVDMADRSARQHQDSLEQQFAEKRAYADALAREVKLLRDKQRVLHLQKEQNTKLRALFAKTRRDLVAQQKQFESEETSVVVALQKEADVLEGKIARMMNDVPSLEADDSQEASDGQGSAAKWKVGLGGAPSFLFSSEEWALVQDATAAEKEQLLLERAVQSASEKLHQLLRTAENEQARARSSYAACEQLITHQRTCQADVEQLQARVAEQALKEAALQDALRVAQRAARRERDALHMHQLLKAKFSGEPPSHADAEEQQLLRELHDRVGEAARGLHELLSAATCGDREAVHDRDIAEDRNETDTSTATPTFDALVNTAVMWLDEASSNPQASSDGEDKKIAAARRLAHIGHDAYGLSSSWCTLRGVSARLDKLSRRIHRHLTRRGGAVRGGAANPEAPAATVVSLPAADEVLQQSEEHYRHNLFPALHDAASLLTELEKTAWLSLSIVDHAATQPTSDKDREIFMAHYWWHLLSLCAANISESTSTSEGASQTALAVDWRTVLAQSAKLNGTEDAFYQSLKNHVMKCLAETSTET